MKCSKN